MNSQRKYRRRIVEMVISQMRWRTSRGPGCLNPANMELAAPLAAAGGQTPPPPRRPKDAPWREGALRYASHCPLAAPLATTVESDRLTASTKKTKKNRKTKSQPQALTFYETG